MEQHIHELWDHLIRPADEKEGISSLIPLPHSYVVPGGRFREMYYWDSYFTLRGLAVSDRRELVENMLRNFAWLADEICHIPNGNRTYYLSRSQPPFFAAMVSLFQERRSGAEAMAFLPELEKEHRFWMQGAEGLRAGGTHRRVVRMEDGSLLNRYYDDRDTPRPESYREDVATADAFDEKDKPQVYRDIRAAAESGWDFSSRWFDDGENLSSIQTTLFVPADLNSLLYHLETVISELAALSGQAAKAERFARKAAGRQQAINRWLWSEQIQAYGDYNLQKQALSTTFSLAMVYPLYFKIATAGKAAAVANQLEQHFLMPGGLVTTLRDTGEQWDYPNGWAPLQWLAIQGLAQYGHHALSDEIASRWLNLNRKVFQDTGRMMEKYNVVDLTLLAGGGEYPLQDGFGWTNGVALAITAREREESQQEPQTEVVR